jgi:hypothetical protein
LSFNDLRQKFSILGPVAFYFSRIMAAPQAGQFCVWQGTPRSWGIFMPQAGQTQLPSPHWPPP